MHVPSRILCCIILLVFAKNESDIFHISFFWRRKSIFRSNSRIEQSQISDFLLSSKEVHPLSPVENLNPDIFTFYLSLLIPFNFIILAKSCWVTLYNDGHYRGFRKMYTQDTRFVRENNDAVSSLKIADGCCVVAYEHGHYKGKSERFCKNTAWVGSTWNDKISSIKIISNKDKIISNKGKLLGHG